MSNTIRLSMPIDAPRVLAAPRQIWLASLGAAAYARSWADKEAVGVFRALVREGAVVESHAVRYVGRNVEASLKRADGFARNARHTIGASAVALARVTSQLRDKLPTVRAGISVQGANRVSPRKAKPQRSRSVKRTTKSRKARAR